MQQFQTHGKVVSDVLFLKNGGKPKEGPNSYRRITVTSAIGKVLEKLHLYRNQSTIRHQQSYLQKGFTEGEAPSIAGLVLTELNIEAKEKRNPVYIQYVAKSIRACKKKSLCNQPKQYSFKKLL